MNREAAETLVRGLATTTALAASALSHLGWWFDWHTSSAGGGSRPLDDESSD